MCWCAEIRTPLEGVLIYAEPGLKEWPGRQEWEQLCAFLEGRMVQFEVVESTARERLDRFGTAHRPVVVIGANTVIGCDKDALVRLLP